MLTAIFATTTGALAHSRTYYRRADLANAGAVWPPFANALLAIVGLAVNVCLLLILTVLALLHRPAASPIPEALLTVTGVVLIVASFVVNGFMLMGDPHGFPSNRDAFAALNVAWIVTATPTVLLWVRHFRSKTRAIKGDQVDEPGGQ